MRWRTILFLLLAAGSAVVAGCGPATATVSGEVTLDGKPLEKGVISYVPADANGAPATASIENGKYRISMAPGNKRVQISFPKVVDKRREYNSPDAPLVEITAEQLPERYNTNTELTFEAQAGSSTKDWPLESKGRKQ